MLRSAQKMTISSFGGLRGLTSGLTALAPLLLIGYLPLQQCGGSGGDDDTPGGGGAPSAVDLLALTSTCSPLPGVGKFAKDDGGAATIPMCELNGAIWFNADMDIDCDGGTGLECKSDPYYQPDTSCSDSSGDALDASNLPFVVLPLDGNGWDDANYGIKCGTVIAVIYGDQVEYGVFGDRGPKGVVGEASYAMAELFGINSSPTSGGVDSGVTYIVFTDNAVVTPIDSHSAAQTLGEQEAAQLIVDN